MRGICINTDNAINLVIGQTYFLFPHGSNHYYVSHFNREGSHFGAYRKQLFREVIEQQKEDLQNNKVQQLSLFDF